MKKVLLVEDDEHMQKAISEMLTTLGFEVKSASDGQQALSLLTSEHFALVMTDIQMPRLNGISLLKSIQAKRLKVPVILMTGYSDSLDLNIDCGAAAFLEKPFTADQLERVLRMNVA